MTELKMQTKTMNKVWFSDLEAFVLETTGRSWSALAQGEYNNGSSEEVDLVGESWSAQEYLDSEMNEWLTAEIPPTQGNEYSSEIYKLQDKFESLSPSIPTMLFWLRDQGFIENAIYLVDIWW